VLTCLARWSEIDEIGCGEFDVYMSRREICEACPRRDFCDTICDAVTTTTEKYLKTEYEKAEAKRTLLGPCANCGESRRPDGAGHARCPKCDFTCLHALPKDWCRCEAGKEGSSEQYIVWEGGGHGWICGYCGNFTQTG
jgi:hypothetical protein